MKKVCVVTACRSEYGTLRWIMQEIADSSTMELQLVVTGAHLSPEHGYTYKQIEADGFTITRKIEYLLSSDTARGAAKSTGVCALAFADAFQDLKPDLLVVLGDRYELLPICTTALLMGIPMAHISGGDITEGAIDNQIRNAITAMSDLHFPGTKESAINVSRMINSDRHVRMVGEPGLEHFIRTPRICRANLAEALDLCPDKKWILVTLHPETMLSTESSVEMARNMMEVLKSLEEVEIIITQANADVGGAEMNACYTEYSESNDFIHFFNTLGQKRYLSCMREVACVVGNSSSGIIEAPFLGIPVVNIGNRQKGRHLCSNVLSTTAEKRSIKEAVQTALNMPPTNPDYYYGNGHCSRQICEYIQNFLYPANLVFNDSARHEN